MRRSHLNLIISQFRVNNKIMDSKVTWKFIAIWIVVCLLIGIAGSSLKAQNYKQKDISQSDFVIYVDTTMPSHIPIRSQILDSTITYRMGDYMPLPYKLTPCYELEKITINGLPQKTIDAAGPHIRIEPTSESFEYFDGVKWIAPRDKSTIIEYLMNLIAELMEPGETITIKKARE